MPDPAILVSLRFAEFTLTVDRKSVDYTASTGIPCADELKALLDMTAGAGLVAPTVVDGLTNFARQCGAGAGLAAKDLTPGASLTARDVTVRALVAWDFDAQAALGTTGVLISRGVGGGSSEYVAYAIEFRVVNVAARIGEIRFYWQDLSGVLKTQLGAQFVAPTSTRFMMITASRHWTSSTQVQCRYYVGGDRIGDVFSADGSIGGGTTGTTTVAYSALGGASNFFCGKIDEIQILNYEISTEETAATWNRIARLQPDGYTAMRQLMPDIPISDIPTSRIQKLLRGLGHIIGYATAQADNLANLLPSHAYGPALDDWESAMKEPPRPTDALDQRRKRILSRFGPKLGVSLPGLARLAPLLDVAPEQLQFLSYAPTIEDPVTSTTFKAERWWNLRGNFTPGVTGTTFSEIVGADCRVDLAPLGPCFFVTPIDDPAGISWQAKLIAPASQPANTDYGLVLWDFTTSSYILYGLYYNGVNTNLCYQRFVRGVAIDPTPVVAIGSGPFDIWLRIRVAPGSAPAITRAPSLVLELQWSTTDDIHGFTSPVSGLVCPSYKYAGFYARSTSGPSLPAGLTPTFTNAKLRIPRSQRGNRWYVLRDPTLPGKPDYPAAQRLLSTMELAETEAHVVQASHLLCDTSTCVTDSTPMGDM